MINKVALHYKAEGDAAKKLESMLLGIAPRIRERISNVENARVRVMSLVEGAVDKTPHVVNQGFSPTALRFVLEFGHEEARLADLIGIAGAALLPVAKIADAQSSCALAGREYVFCPGDASHTLRVYLGRPLEMNFGDFHSHWLDRHGWLVKPRVDARRGAYRQFHADPKASFFAARAAGVGRHEFEGAAEAFQPDLETYLRAMRNVSDAILEDEKRFINAPDTEVGFYRIILDLG